MKKLNRTSAILAISIIIQLICTVFLVPASFAAGESITIQMYNGNTQASSNTISPNFKIYNQGSTTVNLSNVKVRYYYTSDGITGQTYTCDYAGNSTTITSSTKGQIVSMTSQTSNANNYLEIYFTSSAGSLSPGKYIEVKGRITNANYKNYNQSNDYSFNSSATNYVASSKVTTYINGVLSSGTEPVTVPTSSPTPTPSKSKVKIKYEAENGYTNKSDMIMSNSYCSNGKYVGNLGLGNSLTIKADIPETATYTLSIYYRTAKDKNVRFSQTLGTESYTIKCPGNVNPNIIGGVSKEVFLVKGTCNLVLSNPTESAPDIDFITITKNLVANTDFEAGTSNLPNNWKASSSNCSWDTTGGVNGSKALKITSSSIYSNNYYESDEIELEPYKFYRAEVSVRASISDSSNWYTFQGANISVLFKGSNQRTSEEQFWGMISKGLVETNNGWKTAIINFQAPYNGKVKFRLNNSYGKGTCWFDNFKLYPDDNMVKMEGKKVMFGYERTDLIDSGITSNNIDNYISQYDKLIDENIKLTGLDFTKHFENEKIKILSRIDQPWGGEASAKVFIWFSDSDVVNDLTRFNTYNSLSWALPHEIGHTFDRNEWNFDGEFWASFKAYAALTNSKSKIFMNGTYMDAAGTPGLKEYFTDKDLYQFDNNTYAGDFILGQLASRSGISWSSYTKAFQYFANSTSIPYNNYEKFYLFMNKLDEYENNAPGTTLSLFTRQQLNVIEHQLNKNSNNVALYEAELYASSSYARKNIAECSGGQCVELLGNNNIIEFDVYTGVSGTHLLRVNYSSFVDNNLKFTVTNSSGSKAYTVNCKYNILNTPRGEFLDIELNSGKNTIQLENLQGKSINIDCFEVLKKHN